MDKSSYVKRQFAVSRATDLSPMYNQITPQEVGLTVPVEARRSYRVKAQVFISVGHADVGLRIAISMTGGRGGFGQGFFTIDKDFDEPPVGFFMSLTGGQIVQYFPDECSVCFKVDGVILGGNELPDSVLSIKIAQGTASEQAVQIMQGSYVMVSQF